MTGTLDPFYLIVGDADWVERLVPLGVRFVQLRVKDRDEDDIRSHIRRAKAVCAAHDCQLVINDYWQLAIEEGCDYIHLGQGDLDTADLAAIKKAGLRFGVSTHDHAELERGLATDPDYVALGPIYQTLLKKMPWAPQGLEKITEWKRLIGDRPLIAIGGLTVPRLPAVFEAGADVAAVVTDIVTADDPETKTREWIRASTGPKATRQ